MRIHLFQGTPKINDITSNLSVILREIEIGANANASVICFPESFLTGYPMEDRIFYKDLKERINLAINAVLQKSKEFGKAVITLSTPLFEGERIFNAVLMLQNGNILGILKKQNLPNYGVFNEKRYFASSNEEIQVFNVGSKSLVFAICEDIWSDEYVAKVNNLNPDLVIVLNASPFERGKFEKRLERVRKLKSSAIYLNQVLGYDEIVFDGRSFGTLQNGKIAFVMNAFMEENFTYTLNTECDFKIEDELHITYNALVFGLKEYCVQNGISKLLIGLSGGIDSALCTKIALDAVGDVIPVMLPSRISSEESKKDALDFIKMHGLEHLEIPIIETLNAVQSLFEKGLKPISLQNLQSRIRGLILMTLSGETGRMLLTTGNKSELSVGYCTIYGDTNGGFNPIKDLFKTEVFEICKFLNAKSSIFPINIINKLPTAELEMGQTDETSLGMPYEVLDFILKMLIEDKEDVKVIAQIIQNNRLMQIANQFRVKSHLPALTSLEIVDYVFTLLKNAQFKRSQAPVGTKISPCAFGRDWQFGVKI